MSSVLEVTQIFFIHTMELDISVITRFQKKRHKRRLAREASLNRTHFTGKIPVNTYETSLIVPPSTISLRFARLSS